MKRNACTLSPPVHEGDHKRGAHAPLVTLLWFGDYACRQSREVHAHLDRLCREMGEALRVVFRHYPHLHACSRRAAEAAEAAAAQGRFWEMHTLLLDRQSALRENHLIQYAAILDLDTNRFDGEVAGGLHAAKVDEDLRSAAASGVRVTPALFVNGERYEDELSVAALERKSASGVHQVNSNCS